MKNKVTVSIKPAGDGCNFKCQYCYEDSAPQKKRIMSVTTMKTMHKAVLGIAEEIKMLWHGGEPLLAGYRFFDAVFDVQAGLAQSFTNNVQTNLSLMNGRFARMFCQADANIGTSIDGPKNIHDRVRKYPNHRGTHSSVMRGVSICRENDLEPGVIATFTRPMVGKEMEVYDFMATNGFNWMLNQMEDGDASGLSTTDDEYADAMINLFETYVTSDGNRMVTLDELIKRVLKFSRNPRHREEGCQGAYLGIDSDGKIYPCVRFTHEDRFSIGNVKDGKPVADLLSNQLIRDLTARNPDECKDCEYLPICDKGCPYHTYVVTGGFDNPDVNCHANKRIYAHIIKRMEEMSCK